MIRQTGGVHLLPGSTTAAYDAGDGLFTHIGRGDGIMLYEGRFFILLSD